MKLERTPASGHGPPDLFQQRAEALAVAEPPHGPQHAAAGVLEGQVEVGNHSRGRRHDLDQPRPQFGGLQVTHPHPLDPRHRRQLGEHGLEQPQVAQVLAVGGGVLADQEELPHALARQPARLGHQVLRRPGDERAAERGDRAEAAPAVAARCDLQRRHHAVTEPAAQHPRSRGRGDTRRKIGDGGAPVPRDVPARGVRPAGRRDREQPPAVAGLVRGPPLAGQHRIEPAGDVAVVVEAEDLRLGQRLGEVGAVAFRQAARGHDLRAARSGAEQLVDRLLLGRLDEAAGVDQDHVGFAAPGGVGAGVEHGPARGLEAGGELLRVDLIARAAQRHQAHAAPGGARHGGVRRHTGRLR